MADFGLMRVESRRIEDATGLQKQTFDHMQQTHEVSSKQVIRKVLLCRAHWASFGDTAAVVVATVRSIPPFA